MAAISPRIHDSVTPCAIAPRLARWIVRPSAIGSVNGTPTSTTSAAAATSASISLKRAFSG